MTSKTFCRAETNCKFRYFSHVPAVTRPSGLIMATLDNACDSTRLCTRHLQIRGYIFLRKLFKIKHLVQTTSHISLQNRQQKKPFNYIAYLPMVEAQQSKKKDQINQV